MDCPASAPPILRCLLPRIFCQLGFFDCKQQKLTLAKQNDDGRAGEPGLGKDSVRGGSGDLSNRVQDPTTGMNQLPPFPVHFLTLQIPKREKTGLSGWQSHQDCTQWVSSSKEKLGCYRLTEEMGHGKARTSLSTGLHLRRRELSEFKAVSPLPSLPNFLSQFP